MSATPVTPKFSLQYFFTPDSLVYATVAKGFRAGGVNQVTTSATDGTLARYGLTAAGAFPRTYEPDSVWNHELGAKFRLWEGKAQLNAAVYDIEWKNVQYFYFTGDGAVFNLPSARSRGVEFEGQLRPFRPLTLNAAAAYTKSEYTSGLNLGQGPGSTTGTDLVLVTDGQLFPQPAWTFDVGARYDLRLGDQVNAYARVDYRWQEDFATAVQGTPAYSPDSSVVPAQKNVNLRLGFEFREFDVSLFALNLTDQETAGRTGGRSGCLDADCNTYNTYTYGRTIAAPVPRQFGLQVAYRR
ncbi:MAG: TonB-dependent receptor [Proteobacteria bacterium]|nr:MAG: TonB-dependent receptor [Pseudomonadota bacterium]